MWAQVSLYQFTQSNQAYTEITAASGGYMLGTALYFPPLHNLRAYVDPNNPDGVITNSGYLGAAVGPGYPVGFNFTYNGDVFDRIGVSHGGWISFGKSSDGNQAVWTYTGDHPHGRPFVQYIGGPDQPYKRNRIAGFANSELRMQDNSSLLPPGPVSSLRIATIGTAPNRVCVIQWHDFRMSYSPSGTLINFQIRLNESDNSVEVRYGPTVFASGGSAQVGLGGRLPEDFNSRMTVYEQPAFLYDWNVTVRGVENTDACDVVQEQPFQPNGSGVPPVSGLNFKWAPAACAPPVWPVTIVDIGFDAAGAQWEPNSAGEYEYYVSNENSITGPEVSSGTTSDPEAFFFGLEASTTYYVFVRSICAGVPGTWSLATVFVTKGGGMVECDGTVMTENYCSAQNSVKEWLYISADGSPLRIEFLSGLVGSTGTASFKVWAGTDDTGTLLFTGVGPIAGNAAESSGSLYIRLTTDNGACEAQPWFLPLEWRVGCKNCTDPLATFSVVEDCDNMQYSVAVNIFNLGSSNSVSLENSLGVAPTVANSTGLHVAGPFPAGQSVVVTVQNPNNLLCYVASAPLINAPCVMQDCGPTTSTYCYSDNEFRQWSFQGEGGQEIGIRFISGTMGLGDVLRTYNGLDIDNLTPTIVSGGLANKLITSSAPSTDHALVMELQADAAMSCVDEDPLYGTSQPWKYVVACYDGCLQPKATFTTECISSTQFNIIVTLTDVGSTSSVSITNNGGAPVVTATELGTYTVGPFSNDVPVTVEVEGASILCTWTSSVLTQNCVNIGIDEVDGSRMRVFPNPSNGSFQVELPQGLVGTVQLQVLDVAGRLVGDQSVNSSSTSTLDLQHLPSGLYTLVLQGEAIRTATTISIQH